MNDTKINVKIGNYIFDKSIETNFKLAISKRTDDIIEFIEPHCKEWQNAYKLYHNYIYDLEGLPC
jgi:hypothetical protein